MTRQEGFFLGQFDCGPMRNYSYLIGDKKAGVLGIVDPGWDIPGIVKIGRENSCEISCILLTHGHADHVTGISELQETHDIPVYISEHEAEYYLPECKNLRKVTDHQKILLGNIEIECLWTPGHTPGCQCFRYQDVLLTGDTLFIDACGRCDMPGGDLRQMYHSLYEIIMKLPDDVVIYSGHSYASEPSATLGSQKKTNPYLQCRTQAEFLQLWEDAFR